MVFKFNSNKKIFPLLDGCVDIHCHILPNLDDGAKTMEETWAMLRLYQKLGFKKIIATPHILKGHYPNTPKTISEKFDVVSAEVGKEIDLKTGAEYMVDEDFEIALRNDDLLPLKNKYILIEMSYFQQPVNFSGIVFELLHKGYVPVLAHPERYNFIKSLGAYQELKKMGCLFQLNLLALNKHYGPLVQKKTAMLLKNDLYDFLATDAHHVKHLEEIGSIGVSKSLYGKIKKLTERNTEVFM